MFINFGWTEEWQWFDVGAIKRTLISVSTRTPRRDCELESNNIKCSRWFAALSSCKPRWTHFLAFSDLRNEINARSIFSQRSQCPRPQTWKPNVYCKKSKTSTRLSCGLSKSSGKSGSSDDETLYSSALAAPITYGPENSIKCDRGHHQQPMPKRWGNPEMKWKINYANI